MSLYESIIGFYPEITDDQFTLQDDGEGAYIKEWNYSKPEPTQEQLEQGAKNYKAIQAAEKAREQQAMFIEQVKKVYQANRADVSPEASTQFVAAFIESREIGLIDPKNFPLMDSQIKKWEQQGKFNQ